jgi:starch synthase (maltosyl-transferring)
LNSEKYEIRHWNIDSPESLRGFIARVNQIRKANPALHNNRSLAFYAVDNDHIICFAKSTEDRSNVIVVAVNLDPHHTQSGWVELPLADLGLDPTKPFQMHDLLTDARYLWHGGRNYLSLEPSSVPAHIFRVRHNLRREQDFDYFM